MTNPTIEFIDLAHDSPVFDAAYDIFGIGIQPEFLETREFLKNRLQVRDRGPKSSRETILVQEGYSLHLVAAKAGSKIVGAVYGHCISKIGPENRSAGFVTYIAVLPEYRRKGTGARLIEELRKRADRDALRMTGKPLLGIAFEIEEEGKEEIKAMLRQRGAGRFDIVYYQPAVRHGTAAEPMHLWFLPLDRTLSSSEEMPVRYPADFVVSLVTNLLSMEYVGPDLKGFDLASGPLTAFLKSAAGRDTIGLRR